MGGFGRFFDWLTILQRAETIGRCLRLQNDFLYVHSETLWSILRRFRVKIGVNIGEDFNLENSGFCRRGSDINMSWTRLSPCCFVDQLKPGAYRRVALVGEKFVAQFECEF